MRKTDAFEIQDNDLLGEREMFVLEKQPAFENAMNEIKLCSRVCVRPIFAEKSIAELIEKEGGAVTKIEENPEGRDLYVSSKSAAHKALNALRLHVKASGKLAGQTREGKTLYRTTYCVRVE